MTRIAALAACLAALAFGTAGAQDRPTNIRGEIVAADGATLTVKADDGATLALVLGEKSRVSGVAPAKIDDIKAGSYIGTAAVPGSGGALVALEVLVFPPQMKGVGEGHRPYDLKPQSTMTNATVAEVLEGAKGRTLKVAYKGGEKSVLVPPDAPIVTIVRAGRDKLTPGTKIFAVGRKAGDGRYEVVRLSVGVGIDPPF